MSLHIAFEKSADSVLKQIVKTLAGPYVHTEMVVSRPSPVAYTAFMHETFSRVDQRDFWYSDQTHDFLVVTVTPEELERIHNTCEACVKTKIPYNTRDMVLSVVPLRSPKERTIFQTPSLFCSQSIVLVLRSCLEAQHPLHAPLGTVNSRTITPTQLHALLRPHCTPASTHNVCEAASKT